MASMPAMAAATERFSFLNVPPPRRPRDAASRSTNCAGASMNTVPSPKARCRNCELGVNSLTTASGDRGENANAPQTIIDALALHYEEREQYPDELEELIEHGYLAEIPRPKVGFDLLYEPGPYEPLEFHYQSLGSSYVLEFVFTEWVQCAYNPPWEDDYDYDYEEEEDVDGAASDDESGDASEEAWSCPESRPELW